MKRASKSPVLKHPQRLSGTLFKVSLFHLEVCLAKKNQVNIEVAEVSTVCTKAMNLGKISLES
jgi:hypothetical protein